MSNSGRNRKIEGDVGFQRWWRFISILFSIKLTAMSNFSASTHFLAEFLAWFQKEAHTPAPLLLTLMKGF